MAVKWAEIEKEIGLSRKTLLKYERKYGLLILRTPSGLPILTKEMFNLWANEVMHVKRKKGLGKS